MKITLILTSLFLSIQLSAYAFSGPGKTPAVAATVELAGTVLDKSSGEVLGGVEVSVIGTDIHSYTDFDGKFSIHGLAPGTYDIVVSYISYEKSLIEKIEIKPGQASDLSIQLISAR